MEEKIKIIIKSLYKSFDNNMVLNGVSLSIAKGSSLVIIGPSGAGKSVLIKTIIGLFKPDSGSVLIDEVETTNIPLGQRFNIMEKCGFLFQNGGLFDSLTVEENITFFAEKKYNLSKKDREELAANKLASVKLPDRLLKLYPSELSGGMQKRVGIARAICTNPEILFFDDPTSGLDPILATSISELIIKVREEYNPTVITITHNMGAAYKIADEVALIHQGALLWKGQKEEMKSNDNQYLHQFIQGLSVGEIKIDSISDLSPKFLLRK